MKRGFIFFVIISVLLFGQSVHAREKEREWITISKVTQKGTTYSLLQNKETDELYFVKEERKKGEKEQYRKLIGTYEERVNAKIINKKSEIMLLMTNENQISLMHLEETTGEITKRVNVPVKNPGDKGKNSKKIKRSSIGKQSEEVSLETPSAYTVTNVTPTSAQLEWSEVEGAEKYRIRVDLDDSETVMIEETDDTAIMFDDLEPGEVYAFYLQAIGDGEVSEELMAGVWLPVDIKNISVQSSPTRISLNWSEVKGTSGYKLTLLDLEGWEDPIELDETHYTFDNLEPGKLYGVLIDVMDGDYVKDIAVVIFSTPTKSGSTGEDDELVDYPDPPDPTGKLSAPENFKVEPEQTSALLEWDRVSNAQGYVLWVNGEQKIDLGKVTTYELKGLTPYTPYELHVRALDEAGRDGKSSIVRFYTLPKSLDAPDVQVDMVTSVSAYLTWKPVKAAKTYTIFYNGSFKQLEDEDVKVTGLLQQQEYVFTIIAENGSVKSKPTEVIVQTVPPSLMYEYDGSLLKRVINSTEQSWEYKYDKNGNVLNITYTPTLKQENQEFDIRNK